MVDSAESKLLRPLGDELRLEGETDSLEKKAFQFSPSSGFRGLYVVLSFDVRRCCNPTVRLVDGVGRNSSLYSFAFVLRSGKEKRKSDGALVAPGSGDVISLQQPRPQRH